MYRILALFIFLGLTAACTPKLQQWFCGREDIQRLPQSYDQPTPKKSRKPCDDALSYIPDTNHLDHTPIKYIRVNFHWVNSSDSSKNFVGKEAVEFTKGLLHATNYDLNKNHKMWLPYRNETPIVPIQYRYVLSPQPGDPEDDGIYFHFDDDLCNYVHKGKNRNLHKRDIINKYGVQLDTVLNIFIMPHHPDSIASPTYLAAGVGVALGNAVKVAGLYENGGSFWGYRGIINHEVGHIFGLSHSWAYNDGCDDTPRHPQKCWNRGQSPECDTMASNNVMDYNALQHAYTPCQIGKVHLRMSKENARQRKFLIPNWCELHEDRHIFIRDSMVWNGAKDLEGHLTIGSGGSLTINCRVSLPKDAVIVVQAGGTLILGNCRLHNACGAEWLGIEIQKRGKHTGELIYTGDPILENVVNPIE